MRRNKFTENRNVKAADLDGMFLYKDAKGRTVYSNPFTKKGWIIGDLDAKAYVNYSMKIMYATAGMIFAYVFSKNILIALGVGVLIYLVVTALFVFKYLPTLRVIDPFVKPKQESYVIRNAKIQTKSSSISMMILAFVMAGFLVWNGIHNNYTGVALIADLLLAALSFVFGVLNLLVLIYQNKHPEVLSGMEVRKRRKNANNDNNKTSA